MKKEKKGYEEAHYVNNENDDAVIRKHVYWAVAGGLIPIPLLDIASITVIQLDMIHQLCKVYEVDYSKSQVKTFLSALTGGSLASIGASLLKAIPGVGTFVGGLSMSIMSGASTFAVGKVFVTHFQTGGTLSNINPDNFKDFYKQKFEEGKEVAEDLKNEYLKKEKKKGSSSIDEDDIKKRLKKLKKMKKQGLLSEDEYLTLKNKIIRDAS